MVVRDHRSGWQFRAGQDRAGQGRAGQGRREKRATWCDECVCAALTTTLCGTHALSHIYILDCHSYEHSAPQIEL